MQQRKEIITKNRGVIVLNVYYHSIEKKVVVTFIITQFFLSFHNEVS